MEDKPLFVMEVMEWTKTLPVEKVRLTKSSSDQWALQILPKNEIDLRVNLLPLVGEKKTLSSSAETEGKPTRQVSLWEDLWINKRAIIQSRIKAHVGISERIPARLTQVRRLDRPTTLRFLQENHLQDAVLSKFKYGLFLPSKHFRVLQNPPENDALLVAVGTFARPRQFVRAGYPHYSFELVRYANLLNTTVVGGLDKLLSHFTKAHQPDDVMTYADLEWSTGHSYLKLGFVPMGDTPPQLFWVNPQTMERYYPHRLPDGLSEQTASERGYLPVFNGGSRKFVKVTKVPRL